MFHLQLLFLSIYRKYLIMKFPKFFWKLPSQPTFFHLPKTNSSTAALDLFLSCSFLSLEASVIVFFSFHQGHLLLSSCLLPFSKEYAHSVSFTMEARTLSRSYVTHSPIFRFYHLLLHFKLFENRATMSVFSLSI